MTGITINNIDDLRSEIARLEVAEDEQAILLKKRFSSPSAIFATALSIWPKSPTLDGIKSAGFFNQDFLGLISRFVLPMALNKTVFKSSNFIVKALVGVLSQKASTYISEDSVGGVVNKVKALFSKITGKNNKAKKEEPYPKIPPYSETY